MRKITWLVGVGIARFAAHRNHLNQQFYLICVVPSALNFSRDCFQLAACVRVKGIAHGRFQKCFI